MGKWVPDDNKFTDYVGTVVGAIFDRTSFGKVELVLYNETDNPKTPNWTERYGVGDGEKWVVVNQGREVQGVDGQEAFNGKANIGKFQKALGRLVPVDELEMFGDPFVADTYMGLSLHYSLVTTRNNNPAMNNGEDFSRNFPDRFEGKVELAWSPPPAREEGTGEREPVSEDEIAPLALMARVRDLAALMEWQDWVGEVKELVVDGQAAVDYGRLWKALEDRELYNELKG